MSVSARVHMPSHGGATGWLNSEPLGPAELRGRAVLVDFWTLTCINWLRTEPYIRAWSQAYRDGAIRDQHFGEGRYERSEHVIQHLLGVERELVSVKGLGVEAEADWDNL